MRAATFKVTNAHNPQPAPSHHMICPQSSRCCLVVPTWEGGSRGHRRTCVLILFSSEHKVGRCNACATINALVLVTQHSPLAGHNDSGQLHVEGTSVVRIA